MYQIDAAFRSAIFPIIRENSSTFVHNLSCGWICISHYDNKYPYSGATMLINKFQFTTFNIQSASIRRKMLTRSTLCVCKTMLFILTFNKCRTILVELIECHKGRQQTSAKPVSITAARFIIWDANLAG